MPEHEDELNRQTRTDARQKTQTGGSIPEEDRVGSVKVQGYRTDKVQKGQLFVRGLGHEGIRNGIWGNALLLYLLICFYIHARTWKITGNLPSLNLFYFLLFFFSTRQQESKANDAGVPKHRRRSVPDGIFGCRPTYTGISEKKERR